MIKKHEKESVIERKGFKGAFNVFLSKQFPQLAGPLVRDKVIEEVEKMVDRYYPPVERLRMGQVIWYAVDENEKSGYGKRIEDCEVRPVILDLINESDIEDLLTGVSKRERQKKIAVRLFRQAYEQKGVLTLSDVSSIMRMSAGTISKYVRDYEEENKKIVPRRGNIHDLGRTLTHKKIICEKYFKEGYTIESTARQTDHSPEAVTRYTNDFKRVRECLKSGWKIDKIAYATGLSKSLTKEYVDIMKNTGYNLMDDETPF
jgi:hypothetical protein